MTEFTKTIIVMILTTVIANGYTAATVTADVENLEKIVDKISVKIDLNANRFDDRLRKAEINQAQLLAAN